MGRQRFAHSMLERGDSGACRKCLNYQQPDPSLFTNTWIGNCSVVTVKYLVYRWFVSTAVFLFFLHSLSRRLLVSVDWWKYFLYLTNWARVLAVLHYTTEAVLVTRRWRKETSRRR